METVVSLLLNPLSAKWGIISLNVLSYLLMQARHKKRITPPLDFIDANASSYSVVQTEMGNVGARFFGLEEAPHTIEESNAGLLDKVRPSSPSLPLLNPP